MALIKRILLSMVFIFILPSVLIADVLDNELPNDTPLQVKERARQIIDLGVESNGVVKMTQTMLRNRFSEQQMIRAYEILGEAKRNGLREEPVMNKLYEGIGKNVQAQNIIMAMEKVRERYETASQYAHRMTSNREQAGILTGHIAESLSAGMTGSDIAQIGQMLRQSEAQNNRERAALEVQTLMTVKTMARIGAKSSSVVDAVQTALMNGYDQNKMKTLERAFINQARTRYNPTDIAESFSRGIKAGVSVDELGRQNYMNTGTGMGGNGYGTVNGIGQGGAGGSMGGSGSGYPGGGMGGMGGSGGSGGGGAGGGGGGRGR